MASVLILTAPVPQQAISAGEKFCQRQLLLGTSRKWA
jgi:hypothetical protein